MKFNFFFVVVGVNLMKVGFVIMRIVFILHFVLKS